jgi:4-hydroxy-tetrahydrodipicolinate synthase
VGFLVVTPYYNKPNQEGLRKHFLAIAEAVQKPVILYNVPGRTGVDLMPDTTAKLSCHANIIAIKDATGDLERAAILRNGCGPEFSILSGDDATAAEFMLLGGNGCISVTANVAPGKMRALCDASRQGRRDEAQRIDSELRGLHTGLFVESNPIPVKWAMQRMGFAGPGIRLPLVPLDAKYHERVRQAMADAGVGILETA